MHKTLIVVASGSGGHIVPALTLAQQWQEKNPTGSVYFVTSSRALDQKIGAQYPWITAVKANSLINLPGKKVWCYPLFVWQLLKSFVRSWWFMRTVKPDRVISTGGLLAIPVCAAARLHGTPINLYELNVVPGKATQFLAPYATTIFSPFAATAEYFGNNRKKCIVTPYPVRFTEHDLSHDRTALVAALNELSPTRPFTTERKTMFVLGGSQGSAFLNDLIKQWVKDNPTEHHAVQIIHQAGNVGIKAWNTFYAQHAIPAVVFAYHHQIQDCYNLADVVISRAGAGSLFELAFFKKQSIIIPLSGVADNHQVYNGQAMAEQNPTLFTVINQQSITQNSQRLYTALHNALNPHENQHD